MENIKKRLEELYFKKEEIQKEISFLESKLKVKKTFSKQQKIDIFRQLFVGSLDIYAKKWISADGSNQKFIPVTQTFKGEDYLSLTNDEIELHLRGRVQLATYPIFYKNYSKYSVLQIIEEDIFKVELILKKYKLKGYYEKNSDSDIFVWIFFDDLILSKVAKNLGEKILKEANCSGKIYPNQDFADKSNLGLPLELPLHLTYRNQNKTVFIDISNNQPFLDQWQFLWETEKLSKDYINTVVNTQEIKAPWLKTVNENIELPTERIEMYLYDMLYIKNEHLSKSLLDKLKILASFDNPQVKTLLDLRKPIYNIPRVIQNYEENKSYLKLPRGLTSDVKQIFEEYKIEYEIEDKRIFDKKEFGKIAFTLREEQQTAISKIEKNDFCICIAPPGFGKTLIGAKMIEVRSCRTLVVVNKNMLLEQWIERFVDYFKMDKKDIGYLGKGKNRLNFKLDIATMQSLKNAPELIQNYSQIIVDECHHIPAVTFELIIKGFGGKYLLGLSATPNRKDGLEPILFQQLGRIAYEFKKKKVLTNDLKIIKTQFTSQADNYAQIISELSVDINRNMLIINEVKKYQKRKILILTDRLEHISSLEELLSQNKIEFISVHGGLSKKIHIKNSHTHSN
jgi:hypothetical protein